MTSLLMEKRFEHCQKTLLKPVPSVTLFVLDFKG